MAGRSVSLKKNIIRTLVGGKLHKDENDTIIIEALRDLTLKVNHGERLGLVGHNGAGKTTLLRLIANIYEPDSGHIHIEGKVTPLFDIALGIDPEASGYDNIFLRSLYLGEEAGTIKEKTEEIAEFSELGDFLNMPLRTYSAGMMARLLFSVSTAFNPEILVLDEGIVAGDADFIKKAEKRLDDLVARSGILVLASHSPDLIKRYCTEKLELSHGRLVSHEKL